MPTIEELMALNRASQPQLTEDDERSWVMQGLELANRPYSTAMSVIHSTLSGEDALANAKAALRGQDQFSAYDVLVDLGAPPDSNMTKMGGVALDIFPGGFVDPVSYVTLGFNKAGRLAKAVDKAGRAALEGRKPISRLEAIEKGMWGLNVANTNVLPKPVLRLIGGGMDATSNYIKQTKVYENLGLLFGGVNKFAARYPSLNKVFRNGRMYQRGEEAAIETELRTMVDELRGSLGDDIADEVMRDATGLLEDPNLAVRELARVKAKINVPVISAKMPTTQAKDAEMAARLETAAIENAGVVDPSLPWNMAPDEFYNRYYQHNLVRDPEFVVPEEGFKSQYTNVLPASRGKPQNVMESKWGPVKGRPLYIVPNEAIEQTRNGSRIKTGWKPAEHSRLVPSYNQQPVHEMVVESALKRGVRVPDRVLANYPDLAKKYAQHSGDLNGQLHELQSLIPNVADMPPPLVEIDEAQEWLRVLEGVKRPEEVKSAIQRMVPVLDRVTDLYDSRLRKFDPEFQTPIKNYLKHMFPAHERTALRRLEISERQWKQLETKVRSQAAARGLTPELIEAEVRKAKAKVQGMAPLSKDEMRGLGVQFEHRKYQGTLKELKEHFQEMGIPVEFEERTPYILNAMSRDAHRWAFAYDATEAAVKETGRTSKQLLEEGANLQNWHKVDFNLPWIDPAKNPWLDMYVPKEVQAMVDKATGIQRQFWNDKGFRWLTDNIHAFRRWMSAWTLTFPSTKVRDFAGDMFKMQQGGVNLMSLDGHQALLASGHLLGNKLRSQTPPTMTGRAFNAVQSNLPQSEAAWNAIIGDLQKAFPDQEITGKKLVEMMQADEVMGTTWFRDLDVMESIDSELLEQANKRKPKLRELVPLRGLVAEMRGEPGGALGKSAILRFGYHKAQDIADYSRTAMWLDRLRYAAREGIDFDNAATYATAQTRKYLIDYKDMTPFEQDVMKNLAWFYTFTSRNLPVQLEKLITEPGSFSYLNRAYQGAWHGFNDVLPEDVPEWMNKNLGIPVRNVVDKDGIEKISVWNPNGWIPMSEITEFTNFLRSSTGLTKPSENITGSEFMIGKLSPWFAEPIEQWMNRDSYTGRAIDNGEIRDAFGVPIPPGTPTRVLHAIRNIRLFNEMDKLNPFSGFTKLGAYFGSWEKDAGRPHRFESPEEQRYVEFLTGIKTPTVDTLDNLTRDTRKGMAEANDLLYRARLSADKGQTYESAAYMKRREQVIAETQQKAARLEEVRKQRALKEAQRGKTPY